MFPLYTVANETMDTLNDYEKIIEQYSDCVNERDIYNYIDLFTKDNRKNMQNHVKINGEKDFFQNKIHIIQVKKLDNEVGYLASAVSMEELNTFRDIQVIYVQQETTNGSYNINEYVCFILANEDGRLKIERISTPDLDLIFEYNVQFNENDEKVAQMIQERRLHIQCNQPINLLSSTVTPYASLTAPSKISVYFTKSGNVNYHGATKKSIDFNTYLRNTVPKEWTVSYYANYPAYLQAGVMASKMYAWYNTVNSKRNYAPYYADVLDDSNDQNYWYCAADELKAQGAQYLTYLDNALNYAKNLAIVTEKTEKIFETQYRAGSTTIHNGVMSQSGALQLAKKGYSCIKILQEYYGSAPQISGEYIKIVSHN